MKLLFCDLTALWHLMMPFKAVQRNVRKKKRGEKVKKETIITKEVVFCTSYIKHYIIIENFSEFSCKRIRNIVWE